MNITSSAFSHGGEIPKRYAAEWENISPPLDISDVPEGAESLALLVEDPDVPHSIRPDGLWTHWIIWNMPTDIQHIGEWSMPPGVVWPNTRGNNAYGGPNPPDGKHRYFFLLYALDKDLDLDPKNTDRATFLKEIAGHIIDEAELMGTYVRSDFK